MSALGANRTRRDGGNDVNDPKRTNGRHFDLSALCQKRTHAPQHAREVGRVIGPQLAHDVGAVEFHRDAKTAIGMLVSSLTPEAWQLLRT